VSGRKGGCGKRWRNKPVYHTRDLHVVAVLLSLPHLTLSRTASFPKRATTSREGKRANPEISGAQAKLLDRVRSGVRLYYGAATSTRAKAREARLRAHKSFGEDRFEIVVLVDFQLRGGGRGPWETGDSLLANFGNAAGAQ